MNVVRKIGYSLLGVLVADGALLAYSLLINKVWETKNFGVFEIFPFYLAFSLFGWILVGIPFVLLIQSALIIRLHWLFVVLIGLALGALAQFLILLGFGITGHLNLAGHWHDVAGYEELAMLVSAVAFVIYCVLVRKTLKQKKAAHPLGTPPA